MKNKIIYDLVKFLENHECIFPLTVLYDTNGKILYISQITNKIFTNFDCPKTIQGKDFFEVGLISESEQISRLKIIKQIQIDKKIINFVNISTNHKLTTRLNKINQVFYVKAIPIFDDMKQNVIAILNIATEDIFSLASGELYNTLIKQNSNAPNSFLNLNKIEKLSIRELEIAYLVSCGWSQQNIARKLRISRGTVSKAITDTISYKLNLEAPHTEVLISKMKQLGIKYIIPQSLIHPCIFILSIEEYVWVRFQGLL